MFCCVSKKGGKTNEKEGQHTHALLCLWDWPGSWFKMGSALFSLLCCFVSSSLHHHKKQNSCPTRRHLHTYSSPSHRQTDTRQFRTRSVRAKTVPQLAKRSNHQSHRARQKRERKKISKKEIERKESDDLFFFFFFDNAFDALHENVFLGDNK